MNEQTPTLEQIQALFSLPTPSYFVDANALEKNLRVLRQVQMRSGCRILLAQKAFALHALYPLIGKFLWGVAASGLHEARLGREEMNKEVHVCAPAYRDDEFSELLSISDHIVFNSMSQWEHFRTQARMSGRACGLRINPECSTQTHAIYDPCAPYSRLGVTAANLREDMLEGISGLHFHTLCEQNADALEITLEAVEAKFGHLLEKMSWLNLGGGHHITRSDYDVEKLIALITHLRKTYHLDVYLEPGEAVALNTGYLVASVLDVLENGMPLAILDASAACHMPDVLEMPYRPHIIGAGEPGELKYTYRLGGPTCLAGDIVGDYSFDVPLHPGDRLIFCDMAHYTMVKNNTFNGINLPTIAVLDTMGRLQIVRRFGYEDFKTRLSCQSLPVEPEKYGS